MVPLLRPKESPLELEKTSCPSVPEVVPAEIVADEFVRVGTVYEAVMVLPLTPKEIPLELEKTAVPEVICVVPAESPDIPV